MTLGSACAIALAFALVAAAQPPAGLAAYARADRMFREHRFQDAMDAVDEALRLNPNLVPALTLRARLAMAANRYDVARQSLERAIAADPQSWYARFLYGFHFYEQNEMPAAIAALEKARDLNAHDPPAALYLGLAYEAVGRADEALQLYRRAIELEEASGALHVETLLTASRLSLLLGRFDDAAGLAQRAAKIDPASRDPHFELARVWLKKAVSAKAISEGEAALGLQHGDTPDRQVHFLLVQAYRAAGEDEQAQRHAEALRKLEGRNRPN
uniref:Tetratricopeptide TPR_2 repeat protein n=1 Tax=Solibacter usitatus (strain Ellin6076) TaxID=234267 RepID=Q01PC1_SOLUE